jgi:hypothetical protein
VAVLVGMSSALLLWTSAHSLNHYVHGMLRATTDNMQQRQSSKANLHVCSDMLAHCSSHSLQEHVISAATTNFSASSSQSHLLLLGERP